MKRIRLTAVILTLFGAATLADAGNLDLGARYGRTAEHEGSTTEVAIRYLPIPFLSLGASLGYSRLEYDKNWYYKKTDNILLGGFVNAHLPLPMVSPYAGAGGIFYAAREVSSPNPTDHDKEHSGTATVQGGLDISLPAVPKMRINIEARRLINDRQTMILGGVWYRF